MSTTPIPLSASETKQTPVPSVSTPKIQTESPQEQSLEKQDEPSDPSSKPSPTYSYVIAIINSDCTSELMNQEFHENLSLVMGSTYKRLKDGHGVTGGWWMGSLSSTEIEAAVSRAESTSSTQITDPLSTGTIMLLRGWDTFQKGTKPSSG